MVEAVMLVALGFLAASLLALAVLPALARRADRLARRRAERQFPLSLAEIAADRDRLRADLAVRERGAERKTEQARRERALAMAEAGRRDMTIAERDRSLAARDERIGGLQSDLETTRDDLDRTRVTLDTRTAELAEMQDTATRLDGILAQRERELGALMTEADALRLAQIEARTRIMVIEGERDERSDALAATTTLLEGARSALAATTADRESERLRADVLEARAVRAEMAASEATQEAARRDLEIAEFRTRLAEEETMRENDAAARSALQAEIARLNAAFDAAEAQHAATTVGLEQRTQAAESERDGARAELNTALGALAQARSDRTKLKRELAGKRKGDGAVLPSDHAALRREIVDVAERLMTAAPKREAAE